MSSFLLFIIGWVLFREDWSVGGRFLVVGEEHAPDNHVAGADIRPVPRHEIEKIDFLVFGKRTVDGEPDARITFAAYGLLKLDVFRQSSK